MNSKTKLTAFSVLSMSLLTMAIGATAGTIPELTKAYPNVATATVELTVTIPSIMVAIFIIISNGLTKRIGTKPIILTGTAIVFVSTVLSMTAINIWVLLISRALLGVGIGLFNSLAVSVIDYLYKDEVRERMLGYQNTFQGIGAAGGALIVGLILMVADWRLAFAIYLISLPILFLNLFFVPNIRYTATQVDSTISEKVSSSGKLAFIYYFGILFGLMVFYMTTNVKLPNYVVENQIGSATTGSMMVVVMSLGTILGGGMYAKLNRAFGRLVLLFAISVMVVGLLLLGLLPTLISAVLGAFMVGDSFGVYVPYIFSRALAMLPPAHSNDGTTILLISSNLANFLCPYVDQLINPGGHTQLLFQRALVIVIILGVCEISHMVHLRFAWEH